MIGSHCEFPISNKRFQMLVSREAFSSYKYAGVKQWIRENGLQESFLVVLISDKVNFEKAVWRFWKNVLSWSFDLKTLLSLIYISRAM